MPFVIVRREGEFVADPNVTGGSPYTRNIGKARVWNSHYNAMAQACGNESVRDRSQYLQKVELDQVQLHSEADESCV